MTVTVLLFVLTPTMATCVPVLQDSLTVLRMPFADREDSVWPNRTSVWTELIDALHWLFVPIPQAAMSVDVSLEL